MNPKISEIIKYRKIIHNESAIEIDGKVVLSFDPRYKEYLKWRDKNPDLEKQLVGEVEKKILYNQGAPHTTIDSLGHRQGKCTFYYENGNKSWEGTYKDGIIDGKLKQYEESGDILSMESFKVGVLHGKFEYYFGGVLKETGTMLDNKKHGEVKTYWINQNLRRIENFRNGIADGEFKEYYITGELMNDREIEMGKPIGTHQWFYTNGQLKQEIIYVFGIRTKTIEWFEDSTKKNEENWKGSIKDGKSVYYNRNGDKVKDYCYYQGKLHGDFNDYYLNGNKRATGKLKHDMMDGEWTFWYHNGKKELECEFFFGQVKYANVYHDNGKLKQEVKL